MTKKVRKSAVVITIFDAAKMTDKYKEDMVKWLRHIASFFLKSNQKRYGSRFTARYSIPIK